MDKTRVKNVLNFKKPSRVIIIAAIALAIILSVGLAINRLYDTTDTSDWETLVLPIDKYDMVFFECNDTPYNPEYQIISAQLMNNQNLTDLTCGGSFTLVKLVDSVWKIAPFVSDLGFDDLAYVLGNGESIDYSIRPEMLAAPLDEGQYRIVTDVWHNSNPNLTYTVWADFTIDKNAPKQEKITIPGEWFGNFDGKEMTIDDMKRLASAYMEMGRYLTIDDLTEYKGFNVSSTMGHYNMQYASDNDFTLSVSADDTRIINAMRIRRISDGEVIAITADNYDELDSFFDGMIMAPENTPSLDAFFDVAEIIERNLDIIVDSTPILSSIHPSDQVRLRTEYVEIVALGNDALQYMFSLFEQGGQTEFRGYVMAVACCDILGIDTSYGFRAFNTGQEWYEDYKLSAAQPGANITPEEIVRRELSSDGYDIKHVFWLSVESRYTAQGLGYGEVATVYASYIDIDAVYNMRYEFERATCNSEWTHGEPQPWDGMAIDVAAHVARDYYAEIYRINYDDVFVSWASLEEAESLEIDFGSNHVAAFHVGRIGETPTAIVVSSADGQSHWKVVGYAGEPV